MMKKIGKFNMHSKKGTTLVELVVAMVLTALFAVVCIALISPIENVYQRTQKHSRAQLLGDTIIDAIRKECDDAKNDEEKSVWIASGSFDNDSDDHELFTDGPESLKSTSGPVLVIKKNNSYCEAIYSCFPVSLANQTAVNDNYIADASTEHAVDQLFTGDPANVQANTKRGIVHFGYYQATDTGKGIYPLKSYDYTNPVPVSTYGDFTVKLTFSNIVYSKDPDNKDCPAFVECTVEIFDGDYMEAAVTSKGCIYSRTAAISFTANGSADGSIFHHSSNYSEDLRNVRVKVIWVNGNDEEIEWPSNVDKVAVYMEADGSTRNQNLSATQNSCIFANVNSVTSVYQDPDPVPGCGPVYVTGDIYSGYTIINKTNPARLLSGPDFNMIINKNVKSVIFGEADHLAQYTSAIGSYTLCARDEDDALSDYYKYYYDDINDIAYVTSPDGSFLANIDCSCMFENCTNLTQITNLNSIKTDDTIDMHRMFKNCRSLTMGDSNELKLNWNTSNVLAMDSMFYNVCCDVPDGTALTIDISSFDFSNCRYYKKGSDNKDIIGINKLFYVDDGYNSRLEKIIFPDGHKDMSNIPFVQEAFNNCKNLKELENFNDIDFSNVTHFSKVFNGCSSLTELDFSKWTFGDVFTNLNSNNGLLNGLSSLTTLDMNSLAVPGCTSLTGLFSGCNSLNSIDLHGSDFSGVTSLENFFKKNIKLQTINLDGCDTSSLGSVKGMFMGCSSLKTIDMSGFVGSSCTTIESVFDGCSSVNDMEIDGWNTSNVDSMANAFKSCHVNTGDGFELDLSDFEFNKVTDMSGMFNGSGVVVISFPDNGNSALVFGLVEDIDGIFQNCKGLSTINGFEIVEFPKVTNASSMFGGCTSLTDADFNMLFPIVTDAHNMFSNCSSLNEIDMSLEMPLVENVDGLFIGCSKLSVVDLDLNFNEVTSAKSLFSGCSSLKTVSLGIDFPKVDSLNGLFSGSTALETVNLDLSVPEVEDISYLFNGCKNLKSVTINVLKPMTKVKNIDYLFNGCESLTSIPLNLNFPNATSANNLLSDCKSFSNIDLNLNLPNVTSANNLFRGCTSLATVNVKLDFPLATSVNDLFTDCSALKNVKVNMNCPSISKLNKLFSNCTKLEKVDLSGSIFSSCGNVSNLYYKCDVLNEIIMSDVQLPSCTVFNDMFKDCPKLTRVTMDGINLEGATTLTFLPRSTMTHLNLSRATLSGVLTLEGFFKENNIVEINLSNAILTECKSTKQMCYNCKSLTKISFSSVTMNNCVACEQMFYGCKKLVTVEMNNFKTPNNSSLESMFNSCYCVTKLQLKGWETSNVTSMKTMFFNCGFYNGSEGSNTAIEVDISDFDFQSVETFEQMFACEDTTKNNRKDFISKVILPKETAKALGAKASNYMFRFRLHLYEIQNLEYFTISGSQYTNCAGMFSRVGVSELDIRGLDLSYISNAGDNAYGKGARNMFDNCPNLKTIYVDPDFADYSNSAIKNTILFTYDNNVTHPLVGGAGTAWSSAYIKGLYARIDDPANGKPGYFTDYHDKP